MKTSKFTAKQQEVIERARKEPARFVEIPRERVRFFTAHDNHKARKEREGSKKTTELLEKELKRLIKTWKK